MDNKKFLSELDSLIRAHSILNHPFYVAWSNGELTIDQLKTYAKIYFPHVYNFPGYLSNAIRVTDNNIIKSELESNYKDEITYPAPHPELWLDFAEGLGLDNDIIIKSDVHPSAENIINTFNTLCSAGTGEALAALYSYESQQPVVAQEKINGLINNYNISDPKTLAYFDVHAVADIYHSEGEKKALEECINNGADPKDILNAAEKALDAYWKLLDGISEEAGIKCN